MLKLQPGKRYFSPVVLRAPGLVFRCSCGVGAYGDDSHSAVTKGRVRWTISIVLLWPPSCCIIILYDIILFCLVGLNKYDDNDESRYWSEAFLYSKSMQVYTANQRNKTPYHTHYTSATDRFLAKSVNSPHPHPHSHKTFRISAKPKSEVGCPPMTTPLLRKNIGGAGFKTLEA